MGNSTSQNPNVNTLGRLKTTNASNESTYRAKLVRLKTIQSTSYPLIRHKGDPDQKTPLDSDPSQKSSQTSDSPLDNSFTPQPASRISKPRFISQHTPQKRNRSTSNPRRAKFSNDTGNMFFSPDKSMKSKNSDTNIQLTRSKIQQLAQAAKQKNKRPLKLQRVPIEYKRLYYIFKNMKFKSMFDEGDILHEDDYYLLQLQHEHQEEFFTKNPNLKIKLNASPGFKSDKKPTFNNRKKAVKPVYKLSSGSKNRQNRTKKDIKEGENNILDILRPTQPEKKSKQISKVHNFLDVAFSKMTTLRTPRVSKEVEEFNKKAFGFLKSEKLSESNCLNDSIIDDQEYDFEDDSDSDKLSPRRNRKAQSIIQDFEFMDRSKPQSKVLDTDSVYEDDDTVKEHSIEADMKSNFLMPVSQAKKIHLIPKKEKSNSANKSFLDKTGSELEENPDHNWKKLKIQAALSAHSEYKNIEDMLFMEKLNKAKSEIYKFPDNSIFIGKLTFQPFNPDNFPPSMQTHYVNISAQKYQKSSKKGLRQSTRYTSPDPIIGSSQKKKQNLTGQNTSGLNLELHNYENEGYEPFETERSLMDISVASRRDLEKGNRRVRLGHISNTPSKVSNNYKEAAHQFSKWNSKTSNFSRSKSRHQEFHTPSRKQSNSHKHMLEEEFNFRRSQLGEESSIKSKYQHTAAKSIDRTPQASRNGPGIQIWKNGVIYEGYWRNDQFHTKGRFLDSKGNVFEGFWNYGVLDGKATFFGADSSSYIGEFKNDLQHGQGFYIFPDQTTYEGEFKKGKFHGQGNLMLENGLNYFGGFRKGKFNGEGTLRYSDGRNYNGQFKKGQKHGFGRFCWPDGRCYEGNYFKDEKHGFGEFEWAHNVYKGWWKKGKMHGNGELFQHGRLHLSSKWVDGHQINEFDKMNDSEEEDTDKVNIEVIKLRI